MGPLYGYRPGGYQGLSEVLESEVMYVSYTLTHSLACKHTPALHLMSCAVPWPVYMYLPLPGTFFYPSPCALPLPLAKPACASTVLGHCGGEHLHSPWSRQANGHQGVGHPISSQVQWEEPRAWLWRPEGCVLGTLADTAELHSPPRELRATVVWPPLLMEGADPTPQTHRRCVPECVNEWAACRSGLMIGEASWVCILGLCPVPLT